MGKIFNKDGTFKNPNRHRVRYYSKTFKKYYSVWIYKNPGLSSYTRTKYPTYLLVDALNHQRLYGKKIKPIIKSELNSFVYKWDVIM